MIGEVMIDRALIEARMRARNDAAAAFFDREARAIAVLSGRMAERFRRGGRLLACAAPVAASDAQHVAVEFIHPVLAGKRALPALDLSANYAAVVPALAGREDIVIGFSPPGGDAQIEQTLADAAARGALCLALPGATAHFVMPSPSPDVFVQQEVVEMLYHVLWETVHVFLEHETIGHGGGAASFLYPFLNSRGNLHAPDVDEVAASIRAKASASAQLRERVVSQHAAIAGAVTAIRRSVAAGGQVLTFGNGGSATDANDLAADLLVSPKWSRPIPAISLAGEAAALTAIANDVGVDAVFVRQLIAHARAGDVAFAISTSGGSRNIIAALTEARRLGLVTVALLGYDGGEIARTGLVDYAIVVAGDQIPRVQEAHASVYHVIADALGAVAER